MNAREESAPINSGERSPSRACSASIASSCAATAAASSSRLSASSGRARCSGASETCAPFAADSARIVILVELEDESLAEHVGEGGLSNVLGFARYRNGDDAPSQLIELVRQPASGDAAVQAARTLFEEAGFQVVLSSDQIGRIDLSCRNTTRHCASWMRDSQVSLTWI